MVALVLQIMGPAAMSGSDLQNAVSGQERPNSWKHHPEPHHFRPAPGFGEFIPQERPSVFFVPELPVKIHCGHTKPLLIILQMCQKPRLQPTPVDRGERRNNIRVPEITP